MNEKNGTKRTFDVLRKAILLCLGAGQQTINQISLRTGINWKTVELHLTYLADRGLVKSVVFSQYVKIFELSEQGRDVVKSVVNERITRKEALKILR